MAREAEISHLHRDGSVETMKHTPGPWWTEDDHDCIAIIGPRKKAERNGRKNEWQLASVGDDCFWDDAKFEAEDRANARLIAAAPALLEALEDANKLLWNEGYTTAEPTIAKAEAAIAQAKGEDQ